MNIVFTLSNYSNLTGSEMYVYELARVLRKRKHKVAIVTNQIGGDIALRSRKQGVELYHFFDHQTLQPDIIHAQQPLPTSYALRTWNYVPCVVTIHSQLVYEDPILKPQIKKYIAVRPEIADKYYMLRPAVVYNGVDTTRFNTEGTKKGNSILFVGTADFLRNNTVQELVFRTEEEKKELWLMGKGWEPLSGRLSHVRVISEAWDVENTVKLCGETASVYLGRTTIEGWMCGKPALIYDVDKNGAIIKAERLPIPDRTDQFDIEYMTDCIMEVYKEAMRT